MNIAMILAAATLCAGCSPATLSAQGQEEWVSLAGHVYDSNSETLAGAKVFLFPIEAVSISLLLSPNLIGAGYRTACAQAGAGTEPFTITISANPSDFSQEEVGDKTIHLGSGVSLRIRKTNVSDGEIQKLGPENSAFGYIFDVRDSNDNPVGPHKRSSPWIRGGGPGAPSSAGEMVLQPGESKVNFAPLSEWYDLSKPGTYTVQVSQHVSSDPGSAVVRSNKVTITLVP